jgi:transcriptional regulator with XRE-family HTH domain
MIGVTEAIGYRIELLRREHRKTQTDLAKFLKVSFQQVQKYEKGQNSISLETALKICKFFSITISEFLKDIKVD